MGLNLNIRRTIFHNTIKRGGGASTAYFVDPSRFDRSPDPDPDLALSMTRCPPDLALTFNLAVIYPPFRLSKLWIA